MSEIWRDVPDYEGLYQVSNKGRVKSLDRLIYHHNSEKGKRKFIGGIKKLQVDRKGYLRAGLNKDGHFRNFPVHRLVALAFIPNPENKPTVNHIDGNKQNNNVENLEWSTIQENNKHAKESGLYTKQFMDRAVFQICSETGEIIDKFKSIKEASSKTGIGRSCISNSCRNNNRRAGGYIFVHQDKYSKENISERVNSFKKVRSRVRKPNMQ